MRLTRRLWEVFEGTLACKCWLQDAAPGCGGGRGAAEGASFAFLLLGQRFSLQSGCDQRSRRSVERSVLPLLTDKKRSRVRGFTKVQPKQLISSRKRLIKHLNEF